uniref:Uncharacterized protein n=1 Tax=Anopheles farauti TaxID=69004 RepID=A0A182QJS8_9DIPT
PWVVYNFRVKEKNHCSRSQHIQSYFVPCSTACLLSLTAIMGRLLIVASFVLMCACIGTVWAEPDCAMIHKFLHQTSSLLKALPQHTYPVFTLCTDSIVVKEYRDAIEFYHNMTNTPVCAKYLGHNRMNVYETIYGQLTSLWAAANCDACAGAVNETNTFMAQSATLQSCLASSPNPCESCDSLYQHVQQLYGQMEKEQHGPDRICFDIADRMNQTRRAWSAQYNCCKDKRRSMVSFASIGSVACAVPLMFYVVMHFVAMRREARQTMLLSATSGEDESQPSGSRATTNGAVVQRQPEMASIEESDDGEDDESRIVNLASDDDDYDANRIDNNRASFPTASLNNLNVQNSQLIDISSEETVPRQLPTAKEAPYNEPDDDSLLL